MSATINAEEVLSGATFTWPDDADDAISVNAGLPKYEFHMIQVSGSGAVGTITSDQGSGYQSVGAALSAESATYRLPNSKGIKIAVTGGTASISITSYNSGTVS